MEITFILQALMDALLLLGLVYFTYKLKKLTTFVINSFALLKVKEEMKDETAALEETVALLKKLF